MARYVTTTIPYVNDEPHVGHALEFIQADAYVRFYKLMGEEVFFNTGTDEHGQKIFEAAQKEGRDTQEFVEFYAKRFAEVYAKLGVEASFISRTTHEYHKKAAQEMWRRVKESGDIYKKKFSGQYCVGCEAYKTQRDVNEEGKCFVHPYKDLVTLEEENYFFSLSKYAERLRRMLEDESNVIPDFRRKELLTFIDGGLEDVSISREKAKMQWGVQVPDDDSHVMYVWFDALTNYISCLGWPDNEEQFQKFWQEGHTVQFAGKDQLRFQSLIWQAMLMSVGYKNTNQIFYHGFINVDGVKMSKSLGNVISPYDMVEKYGTEATRYMLLRHIHPFDDSDMTWQKLDEWYTANLVNGLGNLVARVMKLAETHLEAPIDLPEAKPFDERYTKAIAEFNFQGATDYIWERIGALDERITRDEPFKVVKVDEARGKQIITECAQELYAIARLLFPFMPKTNELIKQAVKENKKPENLFPRLP